MSNKYSAEDIQQLQGLDAVKYRLGMYAGNIDNPNQIAVELISNSVDEIAEGYGNMVHVTVDKDGVLIIEDHGRGIPIDNHPTLKKPAIILSLMDLHTGGKMYNDDNTSYKTSIGLNGIGAKLASATCEYMLTEVWRDGKYAKVVIKDRQLISFDVTKNKTNHPSGTKITYKPINDGTWGTVEFDIPKMKQFIRDFSYFFPIATFEFNCYDKDKKKMDTTIYHAENGLTDMFNYFTKSDTMMTKEPIVIKKDLDGIEDGLEIVFGFTDETMERTHSYCNALKLIDGGTHVQGFKMALTKALNDAGRNIEVFKAKDANLKGQEIFESVVSVISVKMAKPKFENQTKTKLSNNDLVGKVNSICYEFLKNYFADNPKLVVLVVERMLKLRHAKESAKKHRDLIMKDSKKSDFSSSLIGKFSHCSGRDPMKNELIIIEGRQICSL